MASFTDSVTASMVFNTGHYSEGAAYAALAGLDLAMWRLVMKRDQPPNPSLKHWATLTTVAALLGTSAFAYLTHPQPVHGPVPGQQR